MARTHARTKGKSGSQKPVKVDVSKVTIKPKEIESIILKLAKDDTKPSKIGIILRDTYAVPNVKACIGKTINQVLEENNMKLNLPEDLYFLVDKAKKLTKHLENNTRDVHNKRGLQLIEAKIRRLSKYYIKNGKLPVGWSYK